MNLSRILMRKMGSRFGDMKIPSDVIVKVLERNSKPIAIVTTPGFQIYEGDRHGFVPEDVIQKKIAAGRFYALNNPDDNGGSYLEFSKLTNERLMMYIASKCWISPSINDYNLLNGPFRFETSLGYIGYVGYNTVNKMYHNQSNILLATSVNQLAALDRNTRSPLPLPDWWVDKYKKTIDNPQPIRVEMLKAPENTSIYKVRVAFSDTDTLNHTNQGSYIKYCFDAAAVASLAGEYPGIKGDIGECVTTDMVMRYSGQSFAMEELIIKSWQDQNNPLIIHFQIINDDKVIFQNSVTFIDNIKGKL